MRYRFRSNDALINAVIVHGRFIRLSEGLVRSLRVQPLFSTKQGLAKQGLIIRRAGGRRGK